MIGQNYLGWREPRFGTKIPDHPFRGHFASGSGGLGTRLKPHCSSHFADVDIYTQQKMSTTLCLAYMFVGAVLQDQSLVALILPGTALIHLSAQVERTYQIEFRNYDVIRG